MSTDEKATSSNTGSITKNVSINGGIQPLKLDGSVSHNWQKWKQQFKIFMKASGMIHESEDRKVNVFLHFIGGTALEIFNTFGLDEDNVKYEKVIECFDNHFIPKVNLMIESHNFFTYKQEENQTLDEFVTILRQRSASCEFKELRDRLIMDIFVCNMHPKYKSIQEKLLTEDKLDLDKAISIAKTLDMSQRRAQQLESSCAVMQLSQHQSSNRSQRQPSNHNQQQSSNRHESKSGGQAAAWKSQSSKSQQSSAKSSQSACTRCGQVHRFKCPASNVQCRICNKVGHYAKMCFKKKVNLIDKEDESSDTQFFIGHLKGNNMSKNSGEWSVLVQTNNVSFKCILDTGSDANVMSLVTFKSLNLPKTILSPCQSKLTSFSGNNVEILGQCEIKCYFVLQQKSKCHNIMFIIANVSAPTVIGRDTCSELGMIKRVYHVQSQVTQSSENVCQMNVLLSNYSPLFVGLGCLPGELHITVNTDIPAKVDAPRKVPFALHDRLKRELRDMEELDVIVKVTEPTAWVSSLLLVEKKNGQLRVCLDPRNLNQAIQRSHYPIPTLDVVRANLTGSTVFSTLDASSGFWMIQLDEESSKLCTFNTPFGRYRFKRMPYGISCAPEHFHRIMTETFGDLPGTLVYCDDILVHAPTLQEHNVRLENVFKRAKEVNIKFNKNKCIFGDNQVKYLGHIFSRDGISPDPEKVRAIKEMPTPTCVKDLQRFLGLLNYLGPFIQNLASETEPLRELLKKSSQWEWNSSHDAVFFRLKDIICQAPVLAHFDVKKPIVLSADASKSAVGAVLLQNGHPVCYASKTLTSSQERMAQIEKELYAIVFGCTRLHQYLYGQVVMVETDHRPLITLFKKPLAEVPTRLQRMMMKLQAYDLRVEYKPGSQMFIADTLSRAALPETSEDPVDEDMIIHVNMLMNNLPVSADRFKWLAQGTNSDEIMQLLKKYCKEGWPVSKSQAHLMTHPYWNYRHEIHTEGDLLFKGSSIIIPTDLRKDILKIIHSGHQGIEKSKNFTRGNVFWPLMSHDIENLVESCTACLSHRNANPPEPLMSHQVTTFPWEKVGIDFLDYKGQTYVVIEDYYSNYIEIAKMHSTNAKTLIEVLKSVFSRHGIPLECMSDNGPPFNSIEFQKFLQDWSIQHTTSSPYLPRSNGLVESGVKIVKRILSKCHESNTDPYLALLQYRTTPRGKLPSPSELLMSRRLRTQLPTALHHLQPKAVPVEDYIKLKASEKEKQKLYYDRKTKELPLLKEGDDVMYKKDPNANWIPGKILKYSEEPRSYIVETSEGTFRRNRHLVPVTQPIPVSPPSSVPPPVTSESDKDTVTVQDDGIKTTRYGRQVRLPARFAD